MNRQRMNPLPRRRRRNRNARMSGTRIEAFDEKATLTIAMTNAAPGNGAAVGRIEIGTTNLDGFIAKRYEQWRIASMTATWVCPGGNQCPGVRSLIISRTHPKTDTTALITTNGGKLVANSVPTVTSNVYRSDPNQWFGNTDTAAFLRYSYDGVATAMTSWIELRMTLHLRGYDSEIKKVGTHLHNDVAPTIINVVPQPNPDPPFPNEGPPYTPDLGDLVSNMDKVWNHVIRINQNQYDPLIAKENADRATVKNFISGPQLTLKIQGSLNKFKTDVGLQTSSQQYLCAYLRLADAVLDNIIDLPRVSFEEYNVLRAALGRLKLNVRPRGVPLGVVEVCDDSSEIEEISGDILGPPETSPDPEVLTKLNYISKEVDDIKDGLTAVRLLEEASWMNTKDPLWVIKEIRDRFLYTLAGNRNVFKIELWSYFFNTPLPTYWSIPQQTLLADEKREYCDRLRDRGLCIDSGFRVVRNSGPPPNNDSMFPPGYHPMMRWYEAYPDDGMHVPGSLSGDTCLRIAFAEGAVPTSTSQETTKLVVGYLPEEMEVHLGRPNEMEIGLGCVIKARPDDADRPTH